MSNGDPCSTMLCGFVVGYTVLSTELTVKLIANRLQLSLFWGCLMPVGDVCIQWTQQVESGHCFFTHWSYIVLNRYLTQDVAASLKWQEEEKEQVKDISRQETVIWIYWGANEQRRNSCAGSWLTTGAVRWICSGQVWYSSVRETKHKDRGCEKFQTLSEVDDEKWRAVYHSWEAVVFLCVSGGALRKKEQTKEVCEIWYNCILIISIF